MENKVEDKLSDIESLKKIEKNLKEEISRLQGIQGNLEAQNHTAQIKDEQDDKLKNAETMTKYAEQERLLEVKRLGVENRLDVLENLESKLNAREREIEKREQRLVDLEIRIEDLNKQRSNFEQYKIGIEKELAEAKEVIAQADEAFEKIARENDMLAGREVAVKNQEKYWNDEIGKLEADIKQFQIEKENFIGLGKKEELNVKG